MTSPAYHLEGGTIQLATIECVEPPKAPPEMIDMLVKMGQMGMVSQSTVIKQLKQNNILPVHDETTGLVIKDMTEAFAKNHWGVLALQDFDFKPAVIFMASNCESVPDFIRDVRRTVKGKMGAIFSKAKDDSPLERKPVFIALETREDGALFKLFFG